MQKRYLDQHPWEEELIQSFLPTLLVALLALLIPLILRESISFSSFDNSFSLVPYFKSSLQRKRTRLARYRLFMTEL